MAPKIQATKAQKAAAALAGGKAKKKKWNAGKAREKAQHHVVVEQALYDRLYKDAATFKLVTVSVLVDRLKVNGSLARLALKALENDGVIKPVITHSKQKTYTHA